MLWAQVVVERYVGKQLVSQLAGGRLVSQRAAVRLVSQHAEVRLVSQHAEEWGAHPGRGHVDGVQMEEALVVAQGLVSQLPAAWVCGVWVPFRLSHDQRHGAVALLL